MIKPCYAIIATSIQPRGLFTNRAETYSGTPTEVCWASCDLAGAKSLALTGSQEVPAIEARCEPKGVWCCSDHVYGAIAWPLLGVAGLDIGAIETKPMNLRSVVDIMDIPNPRRHKATRLNPIRRLRREILNSDRKRHHSRSLMSHALRRSRCGSENDPCSRRKALNFNIFLVVPMVSIACWVSC